MIFDESIYIVNVVTRSTTGYRLIKTGYNVVHIVIVTDSVRRIDDVYCSIESIF